MHSERVCGKMKRSSAELLFICFMGLLLEEALVEVYEVDTLRGTGDGGI